VNAEQLALAVASNDGEQIAIAVRAWTADYRDRGGDIFDLSQALLALAAHPYPKVRQAVAEASDLFSDSGFDHVLAIFAKDLDPYVRAAAERAAKLRAGRKTKRARFDEEGLALTEILEEAQKKHGKAGRRIAERAARRSAEYFVRRFHHEASKVITPIEMALGRAAAEVGKRDVDYVALARDIEAARERMRFLTTVIHRARDATKTETPRLRKENLGALVEEARAHLVERLGDRAERLDMTIDVDPSLHLRVDRAALLQALQNVLQNGAEAYPKSAARITLSVTARALRMGSEIELVVADRGQGMNEEQRGMVFVPFLSSKPGGAGLGMIVVRKMIEEVHGGSVSIDSERDAGTRITLVLPTGGTTR
jgi:signal transduction histidine kinase